MENNERVCRHCEKPLRGRVDRKFCCDNCRNSFNYELNSEQNNLVRKINFALRRNRRILADLLQKNKRSVVCRRNALSLLGFDFRYHTHEEPQKDGSTLQLCYEFGYKSLDLDRIRVSSQLRKAR